MIPSQVSDDRTTLPATYYHLNIFTVCHTLSLKSFYFAGEVGVGGEKCLPYKC